MKRCLSLIILLYSSLSEPSSTGSTDLLRLISILLSVLVFAYLTYPITVHNELRFDEYCSWSMHLRMGRHDSVCSTSTKTNSRSGTARRRRVKQAVRHKRLPRLADRDSHSSSTVVGDSGAPRVNLCDRGSSPVATQIDHSSVRASVTATEKVEVGEGG
jgi:hypothetical protein